MRDLTRLAQVAASQHGLLTTRQLRDGGITKGAQAGLVCAGILVRRQRGVMALAGATESWEQRLLAAILAPGAVAVASHRAALRLWGLRRRFSGVEIAVAAPADRRLPDVTTHRSVDLWLEDVVLCDGVPTTSLPRTLCDAGLIFPAHEVQRLVDHAVAEGLVKLRELCAFRERVGEHGRTGVVKLEAAIDRLPASWERLESGPEIALTRVLHNAGLPAPVVQYGLVVEGLRLRIDLAYPASKLAIEYDGVDVHTRVDRFVSDRRRQNALTAAGWRVVRVTGADLRDRPHVVVANVRALLSPPPP